MSVVCCAYALAEEDLGAFAADAKAFTRYSEEDRSGMDLDTAWEGLHFLLTGQAGEGEPPLNFLMTGGRECKGTDLGYGPGRYFPPAQTAEIAAALQAISPAELAGRFDPAVMMEEGIYPENWDDPREDSLSWLSEAFIQARTWIAATAAAGKGMLVDFY